jgi:RHS repeat-associated protein
MVWSPVYIDALIARDRDADVNGSLEERLYAAHDANWNVSSIMNTSGTAQERYIMDPFGSPTFLNASWSVIGSSAFVWTHLHQGGRFSGESNLLQMRNRAYSPVQGRWTVYDPTGFLGSSNLYSSFFNNPIAINDPTGLASQRPDPPWFMPEPGVDDLFLVSGYCPSIRDPKDGRFIQSGFDFVKEVCGRTKATCCDKPISSIADMCAAFKNAKGKYKRITIVAHGCASDDPNVRGCWLNAKDPEVIFNIDGIEKFNPDCYTWIKEALLGDDGGLILCACNITGTEKQIRDALKKWSDKLGGKNVCMCKGKATIRSSATQTDVCTCSLGFICYPKRIR